MEPLPHQKRGLAELWEKLDAGVPSVILEAPTGAGKTFMMFLLIREALRRGWPCLLITNRRLLTIQAGDNFDKWGMGYGYLAAGFEPALLKDVQVGSIQTIRSRVIERGIPEWKETISRTRLAIVDEAHNNVNKSSQEVIALLQSHGAQIVGPTATPCDMNGLYKAKVVAGTNQELIKIGLHAVAVHHGPTEPDLKHVKRTAVGEFTEGDVRRVFMVPGIFGKVIESWRELNPEGRATLLFAPGVAESRGFVQQFIAAGHTAAHIDADTPDDERRAIIEGSRRGEIQVVCNRFVMREGVDMPWLRHIILATAFGSLKTYIQAGGRGKRADPTTDKTHVTIQDHGGHWWRFGSLNEDREFLLDDTTRSVEARHRAPKEDGTEPQPICCPTCHFIRLRGPRCPKCGFQHEKSVRFVYQANGKLKKHTGQALKVVRYEQKQQKAWKSALFGAAKMGYTVRQAQKMYERKMGHWPPLYLSPMLPEADCNNNLRVTQVWPWLQPKPKET